MTDARGNVTETEYQISDRTITTKDALGNKTVSIYDELGRIQTMQQVGAETRTTRYEYDVLTNKNTVYRPEGVTEVTKFDSIGNKKAMTTVVRGVAQTTKYDYDGLRNITQMTDAEGNTQRFLIQQPGMGN
jgi:YD repeat-containing protein